MPATFRQSQSKASPRPKNFTTRPRLRCKEVQTPHRDRGESMGQRKDAQRQDHAEHDHQHRSGPYDRPRDRDCQITSGDGHSKASTSTGSQLKRSNRRRSSSTSQRARRSMCSRESRPPQPNPSNRYADDNKKTTTAPAAVVLSVRSDLAALPPPSPRTSIQNKAAPSPFHLRRGFRFLTG
jgi:hypothetical protein